MQSTASTWFCTRCGAANDVGQSVCFSCNRTRPGLAQDSAPEDDATSLLHGRYRLLSQVGVGGFGEVYRALDTQSRDRVVAIKQINFGGLSPQKTIEATDTFNRELHILAPLTHPNLPRIYDHFTDPEHWYLVMEFLEGETLERSLEHRQRQRTYAGAGTPGLLPLPEIFALAFQLCDVLDYLHTRQPPIIFRDLKPANIMLSGSGHIYLIDFGIARHFSPGKTKDTTPLGSPGYAAPEQYGKAQTTARSDLYSLGALLHHLVTGNDPSETPFQFAPLPQLLPTSLAGTRELETLVMRMVEMDSSQRPASAREVKEELQRIASLVEESAQRRIWTPPAGQPPDPRVEGVLQQQVQVQLQKHRTTTRRRFIKRSLLVSSIAIAGAGVIGALLESGLSESRMYSRPPGAFDNDSGNFPGPGNVTTLDLSPNGSMLATAALYPSKYEGRDTNMYIVHLYEIDQDGFHIHKFASLGPIMETISALSWAPDNTRFAIVFDDGTINVWNTNGQRLAYIFNRYPGSIMAWSPDGTLIASSGEAQAVRVFSVLDGTITSSYAANSPFPTHFLSWSPDGTRIAAPYAPRNARSSPATIQVWDVKTSKTLLTFGQQNILQVAWSPNGQTIAAVGVDNILYLFNASNGKNIMTSPIENASKVQSPQHVQLLWSPDSRHLALDNGAPDVLVWNIPNKSIGGFTADIASPRSMMWLSNEQLSLIDTALRLRIIQASDL